MTQNDSDTPRWIGYSKGVAYPVYAIKDHNRGLCQVEGHVFLCWCTFDEIVEVDKNDTMYKIDK